MASSVTIITSLTRQGGPHEHQIAGVATQLKEVATEEFKQYARQVRANARALADQLVTKYGYTLATGGTDNHLVLWDLKPQQLNGAKMQVIMSFNTPSNQS